MKVVIDQQIPYISEAALRLFDQVEFLPGNAIDATHVADADALIVRTRTLCNRALLDHSRVQLVVTATIGYDHLDTDYLQAAGIHWESCPGCNAPSVAQYVTSALLALEAEGLCTLRSATVGIVGVGHVGSAVAQALTPWGVRLLLCDPPRTDRGETGFVSMELLAEQADILTLHTPLTHTGPHPTAGLVGDAFLRSLRRRPVIINSARGGVIDEEAMLRAHEEGLVGPMVVDTWEHEPHPWRPLLRAAHIATPHIAGYSADGKANATRMALNAVCRHFGIDPQFSVAAPPLPPTFHAPSDGPERALAFYDPRRDSALLKARPDDFEQLRNHYPLRREPYTLL